MKKILLNVMIVFLAINIGGCFRSEEPKDVIVGTWDCVLKQIEDDGFSLIVVNTATFKNNDSYTIAHTMINKSDSVDFTFMLKEEGTWAKKDGFYTTTANKIELDDIGDINVKSSSFSKSAVKQGIEDEFQFASPSDYLADWYVTAPTKMVLKEDENSGEIAGDIYGKCNKE